MAEAMWLKQDNNKDDEQRKISHPLKIDDQQQMGKHKPAK
jgi:hypothetical protein